MKIKGIDHIGIAVENIDKAMGFYRKALNLELNGGEDILERHLKVGFIETGNTRLELIESTSNESAIAKYIATKGGGIHHICLAVDNIDEALAQMKKEGYALIDNEPRPGAEGSLIVFIHPKSSGGVLIELKEYANKENQS